MSEVKGTKKAAIKCFFEGRRGVLFCNGPQVEESLRWRSGPDEIGNESVLVGSDGAAHHVAVLFELLVTFAAANENHFLLSGS